MAPGFRKVLGEAVRNQDQRFAVLIAEGESGTPLGFISLKMSRELAGRRTGATSRIWLSATRRRRRGVGRVLMQAGEAWARERRFAVLSLDVSSTNELALEFYRRLGYGAESLCLIKTLD